MSKKVILITGCSRGLGFETALHLSDLGHKVYATMRNPNKSPFKISENNENLIIRRLDLTEKTTILSVIEEIIRTDGEIDVLINNAGYGVFGPVDSASVKQMRKQFEVNVFGVIDLIQQVLPHMKSRRKGHILTISSLLGIESSAFMGVYASTKFAIEALMSSLACTLAHYNIKVSLVQPGAMKTNFPDSMEEGDYHAADHNPYLTFNKNAQEFLRAILKEGQPTKEIAELIGLHIEKVNPSLRNQTSKAGYEAAKRNLVDTTGDEWLNGQIKLIENWL